jgi:predicted metal-dependent hydrolase
MSLIRRILSKARPDGGKVFFFVIRRRARRPSAAFASEKEASRTLILNRLAYWQERCGVTFNRLSIRNQRRRWGSCSASRNLSFNYKLRFLPLCLADYIIAHELCHLKEMNHGPRFWAALEAVMPDAGARASNLRRLERTHGTTLKGLARARAAHACAACIIKT